MNMNIIIMFMIIIHHHVTPDTYDMISYDSKYSI